MKERWNKHKNKIPWLIIAGFICYNLAISDSFHVRNENGILTINYGSLFSIEQ